MRSSERFRVVAVMHVAGRVVEEQAALSARKRVQFPEQFEGLPGQRDDVRLAHLHAPGRDAPFRPLKVNLRVRTKVSSCRRFAAHGFRATASTILNEVGYRPDVIERQLAHKERNKARASYNQAEYLGERRAMMQQWADLVDVATEESKTRIKKAAA